MRAPPNDPTAGEMARTMRLDPGADRPVTDPTNPRYGRPARQAREVGGRVGRVVDPTRTREVGGRVGHVVDPTDPACAKRSD
jgi:hypothetical protein